MKLYIGIIGVLFCCVLCGCASTGTSGGGGAKAETPNAINKIVFLGLDGNVNLLDPVTADVSPLTDDAVDSPELIRSYRFPAWGRDGSMAFVKIESTASGDSAAIVMARPGARALRYVSTTDIVFPFYLYWSPTSDFLTALGSPVENGSLTLVNISAAKRNIEIVGRGQPYYWCWSPGGKSIFTRTGGIGPNSGEPMLTLADIDRRGKISSTDLAYLPAAFNAPACSQDGVLVAVALESEEGDRRIAVLSPTGDIAANVAPVEGIAAFGWGGRMLAYIDGEPTPFGGVLGTLRVVDLLDPANPVDMGVEVADVAVFFWSPDETKIACFQPSIRRRMGRRVLVIELLVLDVYKGVTASLVEFVPEEMFVTQIAPFFDQYHRSSTIWSPDSKQIVVCALSDSGEPGISVLDVADAMFEEVPSQYISYRYVAHDTIVTPGVYPFWSWK